MIFHFNIAHKYIRPRWKLCPLNFRDSGVDIEHLFVCLYCKNIFERWLWKCKRLTTVEEDSTYFSCWYWVSDIQLFVKELELSHMSLPNKSVSYLNHFNAETHWEWKSDADDEKENNPDEGWHDGTFASPVIFIKVCIVIPGSSFINQTLIHLYRKAGPFYQCRNLFGTW